VLRTFSNSRFKPSPIIGIHQNISNLDQFSLKVLINKQFMRFLSDNPGVWVILVLRASLVIVYLAHHDARKGLQDRFSGWTALESNISAGTFLAAAWAIVEAAWGGKQAISEGLDVAGGSEAR
jgi:hypothetical protein